MGSQSLAGVPPVVRPGVFPQVKHLALGIRGNGEMLFSYSPCLVVSLSPDLLVSLSLSHNLLLLF
ncbi:hypothetical protein DP117_17460 [Brasilonema sp. UFV-L1]|nr:hypothetical protein [Brasilonema sp. UFV-L1]